MSQLCQSNPASLFCPPFGAAPVKRLTQCFSLLLWWSYLWQSLCFYAWAAPRAEGKSFKSTHAFISVSLRVSERESKREWELSYCCIKTMLPAKSIRFTSQYDIVFFYWLMFALIMFCSLILSIHPKICSVCLFIYLFIYLFIFGMCMMSVYNYCCTTCYFTIINLKKGTLFLRDWHWHTDMKACRASLFDIISCLSFCIFKSSWTIFTDTCFPLGIGCTFRSKTKLIYCVFSGSDVRSKWLTSHFLSTPASASK